MNRLYNRNNFLWGYIIAALCLGYFWYRVALLFQTGYIDNPAFKFGLRFIFGFLYYLLAYTFCLITNQKKLQEYLTKIYILLEFMGLTSGLFRLYIYDSQFALSIYKTAIKATVTPLAFILAYVYQSFVNKSQRLKIISKQ